MLVVLKIGWCDRESNEMLVLMLQGEKSFSQFLCTEGQQTGLQNVFGRGALPRSTFQQGVAPAPQRGLGGPWAPAIWA